MPPGWPPSCCAPAAETARADSPGDKKGERNVEHEVKLPELGDDAPDEAQVSFWYVIEGDSVAQGQDIVEMITDKAAFTLPSPVAGTLKRILVQEGGTAKVGEVIAIVEA